MKGSDVSIAPPRVLEIDLDALESGHRSEPAGRLDGSGDALLGRVGSWGGSALAVALLAGAQRRGERGERLVVAAGEGVRRGLPTAQRASVLARSPATGLLAEGQVGGALAAHLAAVTDALVVTGRARAPGAVLQIDVRGNARLVSRPGLAGAAPRETCRALSSEGGAVLCCGPAGERGVPLAVLASGQEEVSFTGRGGLGAVLGARLGLKAIVVDAPAGPAAPGGSPESSGHAELLRRLARSPRLLARAEGGTLELFESRASSGASSGASSDVGERDARARIAGEARGRAAGRHGCRGCPTPCGWTFERGNAGPGQRARFGAAFALGPPLGLERFEDALELLAACDAHGIDAKEMGALLFGVVAGAGEGSIPGPSPRGSLAECLRRIARLAGPGPGDQGAEAERAAARAAAERSDDEDAPVWARGQSVRRERDQAALLGQCVSTGGADPMRSFPFLVEACDRERLERVTGIALPPGSDDPTSPDGKGRLVAWHENLVLGVDATGFCAFSTAGLLADGIADLDELAGWILPDALRDPAEETWRGAPPGERLLAAGATLACLRREVDRRNGAPPGLDRPAWTRGDRGIEAMLAEYAELRGLDEAGFVRPEVLARLGTPELYRDAVAGLREGDGVAPTRSSRRAISERGRRKSGLVRLRVSGPAARALGEEAAVRLELPSSVLDVLEAACGRNPELRDLLLAGGRPLPSVWRAGRKLSPEDRVSAGDVLDLLFAIRGG